MLMTFPTLCQAVKCPASGKYNEAFDVTGHGMAYIIDQK